MDWYKKIENPTGMTMNTVKHTGITYKDLLNIFGRPNGETKKREGELYSAEWILKFLNTPFKIKISSTDWAIDVDKLKSGYQTPPLKNEKVNRIQIIGDKKFSENILMPIVENLIGFARLEEDYRHIIRYIFTGQLEYN